jgi:hypothetical protein
VGSLVGFSRVQAGTHPDVQLAHAVSSLPSTLVLICLPRFVQEYARDKHAGDIVSEQRLARNLQKQQAKKETRREDRAKSTSAALKAVTQYGENASMHLVQFVQHTPCQGMSYILKIKVPTVSPVQASLQDKLWGIVTNSKRITGEWCSIGTTW